MKKWRWLTLIPLLAALSYHMQLVSHAGVFADATGSSPISAFGGALWNNLSWLALLLTLCAVAAGVCACIVRRGGRGLMLAGGLCAAASLGLFALVDQRALGQMAANGLPYIFADVSVWRLGLYVSLALSAAAALVVAALWKKRAPGLDRA